MAAKVKGLLMWCQRQADGYRDVNVTNMTSSWKSGLAFCAIIHRFRPDLIDYDSLDKENVYENNKLGFETALSLGIPALLDAEDMVAMRVPDKLCIITYVSQYYNYFKDKKPMGGPGVCVRQTAQKRGPGAPPATPEPEVKKPANETPKKTTIPPTPSPGTPVKRGGSYGDLCAMCGKKVFLMERHIEGQKLFHRRCLRGSQRSDMMAARTPLTDKENFGRGDGRASPQASPYLGVLKNSPQTSKSISQVLQEQRAASPRLVSEQRADSPRRLPGSGVPKPQQNGHDSAVKPKGLVNGNSSGPSRPAMETRSPVSDMRARFQAGASAYPAQDAAARTGLLQNLARIRERHPMPTTSAAGPSEASPVLPSATRPTVTPSQVPGTRRTSAPAVWRPEHGRTGGFHSVSPSRRSPVPARPPSPQASDSESSSSSSRQSPTLGRALFPRGGRLPTAQHSPPPRPYSPPSSPRPPDVVRGPVPSRLSPPPRPLSPPASPSLASDDSSSCSSRHSPPPVGAVGPLSPPPLPRNSPSTFRPGPPNEGTEDLRLDLSSMDTPRSILKSDLSSSHDSPRSILKTKDSEPMSVTLVVDKDPSPRSILKGQGAPSERRHSDGAAMVNFKSILKAGSSSAEHLDQPAGDGAVSPPRSILKSKEDLHSSEPDEPPKSILKKSLDDIRQEDSEAEQPRSILKKSTEDLPESIGQPRPAKPILKRLSDDRTLEPSPMVEPELPSEPRSILKNAAVSRQPPWSMSPHRSPPQRRANNMSAFNLEDSIDLVQCPVADSNGQPARAAPKVGEVSKPEWQIEAERRKANRNGKYVDPEKPVVNKPKSPELSPAGPSKPQRLQAQTKQPVTVNQTNRTRALRSVSPPGAAAAGGTAEWQQEAERRRARGFMDPERRHSAGDLLDSPSSQSPAQPSQGSPSPCKPERPHTPPRYSPASSPSASPVRLSQTKRRAPPVPPTRPPPPQIQDRKKIVPAEKFTFDSLPTPRSSFEQRPNVSPRGYPNSNRPLPPPPEPERRRIYSEIPMPPETILGQLQAIDLDLQDMEAEGRTLEERIRDVEAGKKPTADSDDAMDDETELMVQWFELINKKNELVRKEADLMYRQRQQQLEAEHEDLEHELRCLMARPNKTSSELLREEALIEQIFAKAMERNNIVDCIEEDRIRYLEEDEDIANMMVAKGFASPPESSLDDPPVGKKGKKKKWMKKFSV